MQETTLPAVRMRDLTAILTAAMDADLPVFVTSEPGVGKSSAAREVAQATGRKLFDVRASLTDPVDWRGLPLVETQGTGKKAQPRTRWAAPCFLPSPEDGPALLFLDELPNASPAVQSACLQLVLDRQVGEYRLPDDVRIIAAGNRAKDRAGAGRLITSLGDRFLQVELTAHVEDWVLWAIPAGVSAEVIAFIRWRGGDLLSAFDPSEPVSPTPRSWERVGRILPGLVKANSEAVQFAALAGLVGEGAAAEFTGFLSIWRDLPDPDGVLMDPDKSIVPERPEVLYALTGALARKASGKNAERLIRYGDRLPVEFGVVLMRDAGRYGGAEFCNTTAYAGWAAKNADLYA